MARPLELIAADLRRLLAALRDPPDGTTNWQRAMTVLAYDAALEEACAALDVVEHLSRQRWKGDGPRERRRVEAALTESGLDLW